jgi:hypothetical protein
MRLFNNRNSGVLHVLGFALGTYAAVITHSDRLSPYGNGYAPDVIDFDPQDTNDLMGLDLSENATVAIANPPGLDRRAAKDFYLRVMPLGASITEGLKSTDKNGYRKWLRAQLRFHGWKVNMVGSKQDGDMADSVGCQGKCEASTIDLANNEILYSQDNEGHPGWQIEAVHNAWTGSKWMKPNLVLLNAGLYVTYWPAKWRDRFPKLTLAQKRL